MVGTHAGILCILVDFVLFMLAGAMQSTRMRSVMIIHSMQLSLCMRTDPRRPVAGVTSNICRFGVFVRS